MPIVTSLVLAVVLCQDPPPSVPDQEQLTALLQAKLEKPVFARHQWHTEQSTALAAARESGKLVLGYFTRSHAPCPPCDAFEAKVLAHESFAEVAERAVLHVHVASLVEGAADATLPQDLGFRVVPVVAVFDADGRLRHQVAYSDLIERPEAVTRRLLEILDVVEERDRLRVELAGAGEGSTPRDESLRRRLLVVELTLGGLDPNSAEERAAALLPGANPEEARHLTELLADNRTTGLLARAREIGREALTAELLEMVRQDRLPSDRLAWRFWFELFRHARSAKDVALFRRGIEDLERRFGDDPDVQDALAAYRRQLEALAREVDRR